MAGETCLHREILFTVAKCNDLNCGSPLHTNIQKILKGRFLLTSLAFGKRATMLDPKKDKASCRFYESLAFHNLRPVKYNLCKELQYDLYCPSSKDNDPGYVFSYCRKISTTKTLVKLYLKATQHHP